MAYQLKDLKMGFKAEYSQKKIPEERKITISILREFMKR